MFAVQNGRRKAVFSHKTFLAKQWSESLDVVSCYPNPVSLGLYIWRVAVSFSWQHYSHSLSAEIFREMHYREMAVSELQSRCRDAMWCTLAHLWIEQKISVWDDLITGHNWTWIQKWRDLCPAHGCHIIWDLARIWLLSLWNFLKRQRSGIASLFFEIREVLFWCRKKSDLGKWKAKEKVIHANSMDQFPQHLYWFNVHSACVCPNACVVCADGGQHVCVRHVSVSVSSSFSMPIPSLHLYASVWICVCATSLARDLLPGGGGGRHLIMHHFLFKVPYIFNIIHSEKILKNLIFRFLHSGDVRNDQCSKATGLYLQLKNTYHKNTKSCKMERTSKCFSLMFWSVSIPQIQKCFSLIFWNISILPQIKN